MAAMFGYPIHLPLFGESMAGSGKNLGKSDQQSYDPDIGRIILLVLLNYFPDFPSVLLGLRYVMG